MARLVSSNPVPLAAFLNWEYEVNRLRTAVVAFCLLGVTALATEGNTGTFNRNIRPILSNKCFACHGPSGPDRKGDLRLDLPDGELGALTPRKDTFIIKSHNLEESELWRRITTNDIDDRMPPEDSHKTPLTDDEIEAVRQWILDGAEYEPFWSFIRPVKTPVARIKDASWGQSMIDNCVMARLETEGLQPKGEADKRTLLRRVTFDLTGLPPALERDRCFSERRPSRCVCPLGRRFTPAGILW